jgi:hypothetical protein
LGARPAGTKYQVNSKTLPAGPAPTTSLIYFVKVHKPVSEIQNLLKQVGIAALQVFEHVFCNSLGIHFQEYRQNENCWWDIWLGEK